VLTHNNGVNILDSMIASTRFVGTAPGKWEVVLLGSEPGYSTMKNTADSKTRGSWQGRAEEVAGHYWGWHHRSWNCW